MPTATKPRKTDRLVARLSREDKDLLKLAACLERRSVAEFVVSHVLLAAEKVVHARDTVHLTEEESRRFVEALQAPPRPPPKRLLEALALYRETVTER